MTAPHIAEAERAAVQAGWFGPCVCPEPDPDAVWQIVSPKCVRHGTPETRAAAILAAVVPILAEHFAQAVLDAARPNTLEPFFAIVAATRIREAANPTEGATT